MSYYNLSRRVKNIWTCTFIKRWQRCLGNLHSLHDLYLCINVGCTQQILHVSQAAPLKHCISSRLQLSTMSDHQAWRFPQSCCNESIGLHSYFVCQLAPPSHMSPSGHFCAEIMPASWTQECLKQSVEQQFVDSCPLESSLRCTARLSQIVKPKSCHLLHRFERWPHIRWRWPKSIWKVESANYRSDDSTVTLWHPRWRFAIVLPCVSRDQPFYLTSTSTSIWA